MAIKSATYDSEFTVFSRFSQAFSHVVRGDLSVITNELSYLATRYPTEDLSRVRNRCAQMAATISKIAGLESSAQLTHMTASELTRIFGALIAAGDEDQFVRCDVVKVERFASLVRGMFGSSPITWSSRLDSASDRGSCRITFSSPQKGFFEREYSSWSEFASKALGERAVIDAVVADLITRAHGWSVSIMTTLGAVSGEISVPLVEEKQSRLQCA